MKVGVFAGTSVDTQMGVDLLENHAIETIAFPLSKNPDEQTRLQYYSKEKLENIFVRKAEKGKKDEMEKIFIYCNSLSTAIDYKKLEKNLKLPIITPLETYNNLDSNIKNLAILAANGISAYNIDRIIKEAWPDINTITIGNLSTVISIEEKKGPDEIIESLNIRGLFTYFENIKDQRYKIDSVLLGCTHFPYLKNAIEKLTHLKIIDPADDMIKRLYN